MSFPSIPPGTLITVKLNGGGLSYAETVDYARNGYIRVRWLYNAQDLYAAGYGAPAGYSADTYWRTNHYEDVSLRAIRNVNPHVKIAAEILPLQ